MIGIKDSKLTKEDCLLSVNLIDGNLHICVDSRTMAKHKLYVANLLESLKFLNKVLIDKKEMFDEEVDKILSGHYK